MSRTSKPNDVIIEFTPTSGHFVKVSAIDIYTHEEVCIVGDKRRNRQELVDIVVKKLRYVQGKR
jgi:hypothetical protein